MPSFALFPQKDDSGDGKGAMVPWTMRPIYSLLTCACTSACNRKERQSLEGVADRRSMRPKKRQGARGKGQEVFGVWMQAGHTHIQQFPNQEVSQVPVLLVLDLPSFSPLLVSFGSLLGPSRVRRRDQCQKKDETRISGMGRSLGLETPLRPHAICFRQVAPVMPRIVPLPSRPSLARCIPMQAMDSILTNSLSQR